MFDANGRLIGMVVSTLSDANGRSINLAHAIPATTLAASCARKPPAAAHGRPLPSNPPIAAQEVDFQSSAFTSWPMRPIISPLSAVIPNQSVPAWQISKLNTCPLKNCNDWREMIFIVAPAGYRSRIDRISNLEPAECLHRRFPFMELEAILLKRQSQRTPASFALQLPDPLSSLHIGFHKCCPALPPSNVPSAADNSDNTHHNLLVIGVAVKSAHFILKG